MSTSIRTFAISTIAICLGLAAACGGDEVDATEFEGYGREMPGSGLPEGGEILMEKVYISRGASGAPQPVLQNWFYGFQYGGAFQGATSGPDGDNGGCFELQHPTSFPVHDIPSTEPDYVDWGANIRLQGPGGLDLQVPKVVAPAAGLSDNRPSPVRHHREGTWIYGGPTWQLASDYTDHEIQPGGDYSVTIGDKTITYKFAPEYDFPLNMGRDDVTIPADVPATGWEVEWEDIPNPNTPHGKGHSFAFLALAKFPADGERGPTPTHLCTTPALEDGGVVVPKSVVDSIPDMGIIQAGRLTHWMDTMTDNDGEERRLDVFTIYCSISVYTKE